MIFWDTVMGHQLADTLIRCLPAMTEEKKQYVESYHFTVDLEAAINEHLKNGHHIDHVIPRGSTIIIIYSK